MEESGLDLSVCYEWSMCLFESHLGKKGLSVIAVEDGGELVGIFPVFCRKKTVSLMPVKTIGPIYSLNCNHNDLIARKDRLDIIDQFFEGLKSVKELRNWNVLEMPDVTGDGATDRLLESYLMEVKYPFMKTRGGSPPFIDMRNLSWNDYLRSRSENDRKNFRRKENNIRKAGKTEIRFVSEAEVIINTIMVIENRSWKHRNGSAITNKGHQMTFYNLLIRDLGEKVRFLALYFNDVPISYCLGVVWGKKYFSLKTSYDEEYRKLSPGSVIKLYLLRYCFENNLSEFDFCGEDEQHKMDFTDTGRQHYNYMIFNNDLYSRIGYGSCLIRQRLEL